jgi:hypothetical protein
VAPKLWEKEGTGAPFFCFASVVTKSAYLPK